MLIDCIFFTLCISYDRSFGAVDFQLCLVLRRPWRHQQIVEGRRERLFFVSVLCLIVFPVPVIGILARLLHFGKILTAQALHFGTFPAHPKPALLNPVGDIGTGGRWPPLKFWILEIQGLFQKNKDISTSLVETPQSFNLCYPSSSKFLVFNYCSSIFILFQALGLQLLPASMLFIMS